jgi:3-oxoacyl-[acyl-carrier protein] reductase
MNLDLAGRPCLVTGGSRGIGRATGQKLAREGANVLLVARDEHALAEAASAEPTIDYIPLDLTDPDAGERAVEACLSRHGQIWALVNAAGHSRIRSLDEASDADWQAQWEIDVMAPLRVMRAALPSMREQGAGRMVLIGSSSGRRPSARDAPYSVTKAAELALASVAAQSWRADGVSVNALSPGPIASELWTGPEGLAAQISQREGNSQDEVLEATARRIPAGRLGAPEEVAAAAALLCSPRFEHLGGVNWAIDGGSVPYVSDLE